MAPTLKFKIGRLSLQPGDVLVLKVDLPLTAEQCTQLQDRAKHYAPNNEVMVLAEHTEVSVQQADGTEADFGLDQLNGSQAASPVAVCANATGKRFNIQL